MVETTPYLPGLSPVSGKPLTATFDGGRLSSDGGVIVLREIATRLGLADVITAPLPDDRDPLRVSHTYADMALARMMMIAAGYEDCDDVDTLRCDPAFKIACGRNPETDADLMSQPTLSRLENLADWRQLTRIGLGMIDLFCRSFAQIPSRIVLDIDDTDDPVHGQQELALFNTHAGGHCFQPIHIFEASSGKVMPEACFQHDALPAPPRQAAIGRGDGARSSPLCPPHPQALAEGRHPGARRQPLLQRGNARCS